MPLCESFCPRVIAPRLWMRRAIVEVNRRSPFTLVVTGENRGALFWRVRCVRPRPWMAWFACQPASSR